MYWPCHIPSWTLNLHKNSGLGWFPDESQTWTANNPSINHETSYQSPESTPRLIRFLSADSLRKCSLVLKELSSKDSHQSFLQKKGWCVSAGGRCGHQLFSDGHLRPFAFWFWVWWSEDFFFFFWGGGCRKFEDIGVVSNRNYQKYWNILDN